MLGKLKKRFLFGLIFCFISPFVYQYSPYKIEFLGHYDKVFAHRVNSTEKLQSALHYFDGIELDLVYHKNKNLLDVNHPPTNSIHLNFRSYFEEIPKSKTPFIWLDIKNLTQENSQEILALLLSIFKERSYPMNKVLIESKDPTSLPIFKESGFLISYYLPYRLSTKQDSIIQSEVISIKKVLKQYPNMGISASYEDYSLLNKHFKKQDKYLWVITSFMDRSISEIRTILKDESVKIVLSKFKSFNGNR